MTKGRQQAGTVGEQIACEFLQERGYRIVERNHRSRLVKKDYRHSTAQLYLL